MKGQGLSLNTIIIAILVVLVLVILSVILIRYMGDANTNIRMCEGSEMRCGFACGDIAAGTEEFTIRDPTRQCPTPGEVCCLQI